jgi:hypothetical protein
MKSYFQLAAIAAAVAAISAASITAASASVVCNGEGECWHTHRNYVYHPEFGVTVHPDGWAWGAGEHYAWREHRGRGYWHNGVWVRF